MECSVSPAADCSIYSRKVASDQGVFFTETFERRFNLSYRFAKSWAAEFVRHRFAPRKSGVSSIGFNNFTLNNFSKLVVGEKIGVDYPRYLVWILDLIVRIDSTNLYGDNFVSQLPCKQFIVVILLALRSW